MRVDSAVQPFKSPLAIKAHFDRIARSPVKGARRIRAKPALPTIQEEDEDEYASPHQNLDLHRELDAYGRDDIQKNRDLDEDLMDWDEETTLVALFQDEYVERRTSCIYAHRMPMLKLSFTVSQKRTAKKTSLLWQTDSRRR